MDAHALQAACLGQPGAIEDFPFGPEVSVFKVGGKMFALSDLSGVPLSVSLKCEPERAVQLRAEHPSLVAAYHLNKRHWNTVTLGGSVPDPMVLELLEDSYDLVVASLTRAQRATLPEAQAGT